MEQQAKKLLRSLQQVNPSYRIENIDFLTLSDHLGYNNLKMRSRSDEEASISPKLYWGCFIEALQDKVGRQEKIKNVTVDDIMSVLTIQDLKLEAYG